MRADTGPCLADAEDERGPSWCGRSPLRSWGAAGCSEPLGEAGGSAPASQRGPGSEAGPHAPPRSEAPTAGHVSSPSGVHKPLSKGGPGDGPRVSGSSSAGLGPSAPGLPTRKVQLAVWAEDRAVTKAVLRAGKLREEGRRGPDVASQDPGDAARHPAQGHVATASR